MRLTTTERAGRSSSCRLPMLQRQQPSCRLRDRGAAGLKDGGLHVARWRRWRVARARVQRSASLVHRAGLFVAWAAAGGGRMSGAAA